MIDMKIKEFSELEKTLDEILTNYDVDELASDYENYENLIMENEELDFSDTELYELFDEIYAELGYDHNLHNELLDSGINGTSDLADYVCTIWIKF